MFSAHAPKYWAAGLPVMPLRTAAKIPALPAWQVLCTTMPTPEQQAAWLEAYPDGNMGLPLGPQAGIIGLDLDSEDPRVLAILERIMPTSPWKRIGKKGAVYAFRYNGERTYRIKDENNATILEILSRGAQIVLPPSIHPDTMAPYRANCELVDVLDQLPGLPADFETQIRAALIDAGFKLSSRGTTKVAEWVPSGGRDSALVSMAGLLARGVLRKERTLLEALNEAEAWVAAFTEKVIGDELEPDKARKKVLEFLRRDVVENRKQLPPGWDAGMTPAEIKEMQEFFGEDAQEWEVQQLVDHVVEQFAKIPRENTPARQEVIEEVLHRLSRSEQLTSLDVEVVLSTIQTASNRMLNASVLRKRLNELKGREVAGLDHTEIAQALVRELEREGEVRYEAPYFYRWFGAFWRRLDEVELNKLLAEEFGDLPAAKKFNDHRQIVQLTAKLVARPLRSHDERTRGINFANGFLTDDMQLLPHHQKYGCKYVLPYRYVPDERAPAMFMGFLDQCWGQDEDYLAKIQALREAIAATLFGCANLYQRAFCSYGVAGSGKSTLMNIILGLIPPGSTSNVAPQDWGDRFLPSQMEGKLVNFCGELSESQLIAGNHFKMVVEGAELNGQLKGGQIFKFRPYCAQWFCSNHLPRSRDSSAGFNRRWLLLHFSRPVPSEHVRRGIDEEILGEEREAIVAWAVPAIQDLMRRSDYLLPSSHVGLIEEVASQNNSVRFFIGACEGVLREGEASEDRLYNLYYAFCKLKANVTPVSMKKFRLLMYELQQEMGFELRVAGNQMATYIGLGVKS